MGSDNYTPNAIAAPLGGRYQIVNSLGSGSFGQTFLAADLHLPGQPQCVVKQLQPTVTTAESLQIARRLFETEANVLARLGEYAQIPRLLAHFEEKEEFYLVQELIEGHDLSAELSTPAHGQAKQHWTNHEAIAFLHDLLSTLSFVHNNNVIHRDIKPSNLIRRQHDQRIVLIDFGAVKQVSTQLVTNPSGIGQSASQANPPRTIAVGTEGYMPPEQVSGYPKFSSDLYATGMIAIQGLTGQTPYSLAHNPNTGEVDWSHASPQVHPQLKALIDRMVRFDYRTRYDSASTALAALQALPSELLSSVDVPEPPIDTATSDRHPVVAEDPIKTMPVAAALSSLPKASDNTQTISLNEHKKEGTAAKGLLFPFLIGIAIAAMLGIGIVAGQNLPALLGRSAEQELAEKEAAEREAAEQEAAEKEAADKRAAEQEAAEKEAKEAAEREAAEQEAAEREAAEREAAEKEAAEKEATEREAAEKEAAERESAEREAIAHIERLYGHISAKEWQQAKRLFSPTLAERFRPAFFQNFDQVTVETLQVTYQTADVIELVGQNTYIYPDGSFQVEERTYTLQPSDGELIIVESELVQVLQPR